MSDPDHLRITLTDPEDPIALASVASYYRYLLDSFPAEFTPDMFPMPPADVARYRRPEGAFLVALADDLPVGCVALRALEPNVAEVKRLWVDAGMRGKGLGRRLMRAIEDHARSIGILRLQLDTNSALVAAVALYRREGWTDIAPYTAPPADIWLAKHL
jgi:GNAT superfamily N-acetyltransferase